MAFTGLESEIKPLSAIRYFINNKKKSFSMAGAIAVSVLMMMVFQIIFYSVTESGRMAYSGDLKHMTVVLPGDSGVIGQSVLKEIAESPHVEKTIPMLVESTDYYHFFGNLNIPVYSVDSKALKYVIDSLGLELKAGRLPGEDSQEIALDERTMKNSGKVLGDYIGREVNANENLSGKRKIVGVLKGDGLIGLAAVNGTSLSEKTGLMVFAKSGRLDSLNKELAEAEEGAAKILTKEYGDNVFKEDIKMMSELSSMIVMVVIFIMSFVAGNSSYAQYFSRKYEFGLLLALGYSRAKILLRAGREIFISSIIGFILGLILVLAANTGLKLLIFDPKGYPFVLLQLEGLAKALIIPVCTAVFSLIPAWWTLSHIDQIEVIEKFE